MSRPVREAINMPEIPGVETRTGHPPQSRQNHPPQEESGFVDGSGPLFSMYLKLAGEEDKKMIENWKGDADNILIFTGLFSATVAALLAVSVQDLKPNSQDISAFYLASIHQILADSNGSQVIPPTLPNPSIPFSPPASAVWVNSLWFLSLVISLSSALLATLLQQWARRYMKATQTRYSPHKRAQIRAFFAEGVDKLHLPWTAEAYPGLLHLSLFLFFAGLAVFLFNINHTVFNVTVSWVGFCTAMYMCITFMPIFRHDSPYYAPLSSSAWYLYTGIQSTLSRILWWISDRCNLKYSNQQYARNLRGIQKEFEETALKAGPGINSRALRWTFESLGEDDELERFFAAIPGFCSSKAVDDPQSSLEGLRGLTVGWGFNQSLERTWLSDLVSETTKIRRLVTCIRAIDAAHLPFAAEMILHNFFGSRPALFQSVELGHSLMSWGNKDDRKHAFFAQAIITCIIADAPQSNEHWFSLTMRQLGISEHVLQSYISHGDSVLLANLINFTRQFVRNFFQTNYQGFPLLHILQRLVPNLNLQDTLPELQHDFCGLWNEIISLQSRDRVHFLLQEILGDIHLIYLALHQGPTQPGPYLLCSIPSHHIYSASNLNKVNDGEAVEMTHDPVIPSPTFLYSDGMSPTIQPVATYDAPTSPMPKLDHMIPRPADDPSQHEVPDILQYFTPVTPPFHPSPLDSSQFSDSAAAGPVQGTANHSVVTSMVGPMSCPSSSGGAIPRHTGNTIVSLPPSSIPDVVPLPTPILTDSRADDAVRHIPADATVNRSCHNPHES